MAISAELKQRFLDRLDAVGSVALAAADVGLNRNTAYGWARKAGRKSVAAPRRHPRREEYEQLRAAGTSRRDAVRAVGINERTARDWERGVRKTRNTRTYPDGRRVDYAAGTTTMVDMDTTVQQTVVEKPLHPRYLSLAEREKIRDLRAEGASLRAIGRALGRPASTILREIRANSIEDSYRPYAAQRASAARRPRPKQRKLLVEGRCGPSWPRSLAWSGLPSRSATLWRRNIATTRACG